MRGRTPRETINGAIMQPSNLSPVCVSDKTSPQQQSGGAITPPFQVASPPIDKVQLRKVLKILNNWANPKFTVAQAQAARVSKPKATLSSLPMELLYLISTMGASAVLSKELGSIGQSFTHLREHMRTGLLEVGENELTEFFNALAERSRNFSKLESLALSSNQVITGAQLKVLPKSLKDLSIEGGQLNGVTREDLRRVGDKLELRFVTFLDYASFTAILSHPSASKLAIHGVPLQTQLQALQAVDAGFESTITDVSFTACGLNAASLPFLLSLGKHVKCLTLSANAFVFSEETPAATQFSKIFSVPSLSTLHIDEPALNQAVLTRCLETSTVAHLTLRQFSDIPVSTCLRNNEHIKTLDLSDSIIQPEQLTDIKRIRHLTELKLQNCQLGFDHLSEIRGDDAFNETLQWLDVRGNPDLDDTLVRLVCAGAMQLSGISDTCAYVYAPGNKLSLMNKILSGAPPELTALFIDILDGDATKMHDLREFPVVLPASITTLAISGGNISFLPTNFLQNSAVTHFIAPFARVDAEAYAPLMQSNVRDLDFKHGALHNNDLQVMAEHSTRSMAGGRLLNVSGNPDVTEEGRNAALGTDPRLSLRQDNFLTLQAGGIVRFASGDLSWNTDDVSDLNLIYRAGNHLLRARIPSSTVNLTISYQADAQVDIPPDARFGRAVLALSAEDVEVLTFRPGEGGHLTTVSLSNVALDADAFMALADRSGASILTLNSCLLAYDELAELNPITRITPHFLKLLNADGETVNADAVLTLAGIFPALSIHTPTHARITGDEVPRFFEALQEAPEKYALLQNLVLDLDSNFALSGAWLARLPISITEIEISGGRVINLQAGDLADMQWHYVHFHGTRVSDDHLALIQAIPSLMDSTWEAA